MRTSLMFAGTAAGALMTLVAVLAYGVRGRSAQMFGRSVFRGAGKRRTIALTFDDGPSPGTVELARYLASEGIRATFFVCGANVLRHPEIARELHAAGHELGNHTFSHRRLCPQISMDANVLSRDEVYAEFARAQAAIEEVTGARPRLLRAPYGMRWWGVRQTQRKLGLLGVMWTVIGHDWEWSAPRIANLVVKRATPGGIVCLHDGRDVQPNPDISATLEAMREIVPRLREAGYGFESVSEILRDEV